MGHFRYEVAPDVFRDFPGYRLGVAVYDGLDNGGRHAELEALLREAEALARGSVTGNVAEHARVAPWRDAYRAFGAKPAEHRSSIEAMLRRVAKPDMLPVINPLVDIGNIVSLGHLLPAGVHPVRRDELFVEVRRARDGDAFVAAEGAAPESLPAGEVVLADEVEVLTRRWTWRQSAVTRTLPATRRVFFNVDGLPPVGEAEVEAALDAIDALVRRFCGGARLFAGVLSAQRAGFEVGLP